VAIKFEATGDFSALIRENERYQRQVTALTQRLHQATGAGADLGTGGTRAFREMSRAADQAAKSVQAPADAFRAAAAQLDTALAKKHINADQHAAAMDSLAAKYSAAAGPVDRYAIAQEQLQRRLDDGRLSQQGYDRALAETKQSALAAADGAERYQIEIGELTRELDSGRIGQDRYAREVAATRQRLLETSDPADQLRIRLMTLDDQLARGSITATRYEGDVAKLSESVRQGGDPIQRMQGQVVLLDHSLARGTITQQQHTVAVSASRAEFQRSASPMQQFRARVEELKRELSSGRITQQQYTAEVRKAQQQWTAAGREGTQALSGQNAALAAMGPKLAAVAGGYLSIRAAVQKVKEVFDEMNRSADEAAEKAKSAAPAMGELAQLAETPEEMQELLGRARRVHARGGAGSLDEAARLVFALESADASSEIDMFGDLRRTGLVGDPAGMAKAAKTLQEAMGEEEAGSFADLVSKAFGASKFSPARAEEILEAASRGGTAARVLGLRDEELIAATSQVSAATGSADQAGTQVASLLRSLSRITEIGDREVDFSGMDLAGMIREIASHQLDTAELTTLLGRQEALNAYRLLEADLPKFGQIVEEVDAAQSEQRVFRKLDLAQSDVSLSAAQVAQQQASLEEEMRRLEGTFANIDQAIQSAAEAKLQAEGSPGAAAVFRMVGRARRMVTTPEQRVEDAVARAQAEGRDSLRRMHADPVGRQAMEAIAQRQRIRSEQATLRRQTRAPLEMETGDVPAGSTPPSPQQGQPADSAQLAAELRRLNTTNERQLQVMREGGSGPGASAAAARPTNQRQGR
jgi:hypothetical protein